MHPVPRLIAIDLDGTLLDGMGCGVSERNLQALHAVEKAGILLAIATGRRISYAAPALSGHGFSLEIPIISSNGAVTRTLGGRLLSERKMPAAVARGLCQLLRPFGALVFTFDRDGQTGSTQTGNPEKFASARDMAVEDLDETNRRLAAWIAANRDAIEIVKPLEKAFEGGEEPVQGMIAGSIARMRAAQAALEASPLAPLCSSNRTEYPARDLCILDLMPAGVSKGAALRELCSGLGIERGETMAIGDNWNDLDMLEWAGQAVLMGNAAAGLRMRARLEGWKIAPANVDDGVAVILEKMLERKREKESGQ